MTEKETGSIDVIVDMKNKIHETELVSLFRSISATAVTPASKTNGTISDLFANTNNDDCLYITDRIHNEKPESVFSRRSSRMECLLLVDEETKVNISDSSELTPFHHILSCTGEKLPHQQIMSTVRKIREKNFFGLDKCVTYGTEIHRYALSHSDQRQWFRDSLYEFVKGLSGVMNRPTDGFAQFAIEVQEELLMNAIWDANPALRSVDRRTPVALTSQQTVQVEWSFDGVNLALGVRDPFGTFEPSVVQKYLKFLFTRDRSALVQMQQEAAGAGLGLFMVLERLSSLIVTVSLGKSTEVIAFLTLAANPRAMNKKSRSFQYFSL